MKSLVIVESPTKARTLAPILGPEYVVRASMGHVRDLPDKVLGVDVDDNFTPTYHLLRQKSKTLKSLRAALVGVDTIYLATDPDREGEAIAWHLIEALKLRKATTRRVTFHEITPHAIRAAFAKPQPHLDQDLVDAQQARRILDRLVGYKVSPLLWKTTRGRSAGRVQSVALRLVVDREREIRSFEPEEYWTLQADLAKQQDHTQHFLATLIQVGQQKVGLHHPVQMKSHEDAEKVMRALDRARYRVVGVKTERKTRKPFPPFTTSTMQQSASARISMSPTETMKVAQELYEGMDIGEGKPTGLITYMRTDSIAVSAEAQAQARKVIEELLGKQHVPAQPTVYKSKIKNAQEAHEAIRPTDSFRTPAKIKDYLSARQYALYDLIWRRFIASQMSAAAYDVTTVDVAGMPDLSSVELKALIPALNASADSTPAFLFRAIGRVLVFDGFLRVWQEAEETNEGEEPQRLPVVANGEKLDLLQLHPVQHFTQPPPRYTEAALIKALEERGIGRPSTYAPIMAVLKARTYVELEKRLLVPTLLGETTCDALVAGFPDMMAYDFTAQVEEWLDDISRGETGWIKVLHDFYTPFELALRDAVGKMRQTLTPDVITQLNAQSAQSRAAGAPRARRARTHKAKAKSVDATPSGNAVACPVCGSPMAQRTGPRGAFYGCTRYPSCKGTRSMPSTP